jgi:hypothetical protein
LNPSCIESRGASRGFFLVRARGVVSEFTTGV